VIEVIGMDIKKNSVYLMARAEQHPYYDNLYSVSLRRTGSMKRLTLGEGVHSVALSPSLEYFVDTYSTPQKPPIIELRQVDGSLVQVLERSDLAVLKSTGWIAPDDVAVKAADGITDLFGVLYKPTNFDPNKKYPIIEQIYAGPQRQLVPHTFDSYLSFYPIFQTLEYTRAGYLVL